MCGRKEKKVSLQSGSSSESRAEGPGWRLGFRPDDERLDLDGICRSFVHERNRSFTWSWGGWYIVRRRRRTSGRRFLGWIVAGERGLRADGKGTGARKFPVEERTSKGGSLGGN